MVFGLSPGDSLFFHQNLESGVITWFTTIIYEILLYTAIFWLLNLYIDDAINI